jgi:hypothetical protein
MIWWEAAPRVVVHVGGFPLDVEDATRAGNEMAHAATKVLINAMPSE